jgi:hypothetical protein
LAEPIAHQSRLEERGRPGISGSEKIFQGVVKILPYHHVERNCEAVLRVARNL